MEKAKLDFTQAILDCIGYKKNTWWFKKMETGIVWDTE